MGKKSKGAAVPNNNATNLLLAVEKAEEAEDSLKLSVFRAEAARLEAEKARDSERETARDAERKAVEAEAEARARVREAEEGAAQHKLQTQHKLQDVLKDNDALQKALWKSEQEARLAIETSKARVESERELSEEGAEQRARVRWEAKVKALEHELLTERQLRAELERKSFSLQQRLTILEAAEPARRAKEYERKEGEALEERLREEVAAAKREAAEAKEARERMQSEVARAMVDARARETASGLKGSEVAALQTEVAEVKAELAAAREAARIEHERHEETVRLMRLDSDANVAALHAQLADSRYSDAMGQQLSAAKAFGQRMLPAESYDGAARSTARGFGFDGAGPGGGVAEAAGLLPLPPRRVDSKSSELLVGGRSLPDHAEVDDLMVMPPGAGEVVVKSAATLRLEEEWEEGDSEAELFNARTKPLQPPPPQQQHLQHAAAARSYALPTAAAQAAMLADFD